MSRVSCPHGEECGACALLELTEGEQLRRKRDLLAREMSRYSRLGRVELLPCLPSPVSSGYRNRAKMAIGLSRRARPRVGYFRAGTREIVDAPDCKVLVPELLETTRRIRDLLTTTPTFPRELRHIDLRCGTDPERQHLTLVLRAQEAPPFPLDALRRACPHVDGISTHLNPGTGPQVIRGPIRPIWGEREVWVRHAGLRLRVSPASFFQVNLSILPGIHERMERFLGRGKVLADLYAGVGTHGLALRRSFERVWFIEGARPAVADLKATIRAHAPAGGDGIEVVVASVERSLRLLESAHPDAVVLNPSRAGAHRAVLRALALTTATRIAYLSCEPSTLCRDLDALKREGFDVVSVQPIDMMPQTLQVEALALVERSGHTGTTGRAKARL
jgi:23S rRNA (uracil1939-C5)-methyltransferase